MYPNLDFNFSYNEKDMRNLSYGFDVRKLYTYSPKKGMLYPDIKIWKESYEYYWKNQKLIEVNGHKIRPDGIVD